MDVAERLLKQASVWLRAHGPHHDLVLSSRIRLARNVADKTFPQRAGSEEREAVLRLVFDCTRDIQAMRNGVHVVLSQEDDATLQLLDERQLISSELKSQPSEGGVAFAADESVSFMVNEEDHIRLQSLQSGFDLQSAYENADALEEQLDARLDFAYSDEFGFLTACPSNAGTGMRASVLIHLPGLVLDKKIRAEIERLKELRLTVRGFRGEGTSAMGAFFQISNSVTLGLREGEILRKLEGATQDLMEREHEAREHLRSRARTLLEDRIWRSYGILCHARLLTPQETLHHASLMRLGAGMRILEVGKNDLNEILALSQEGHSRLQSGLEDGAEQNAWRAETIRKKLQASKA